MTSWIPQGSVWDTSHLICTSDWEMMMTKCVLIKFADDTKLGGSTNMVSVWVAIQRDLDRLEDRAKKEHFGSQQGQMQSSAPEKEEPLTTGKTGYWREQFCRKEAGAQQAEQEPVCKEEVNIHLGCIPL
ncbi:hypothetical protein llap_99 [Limosa lapponica baueri]|uniref:Rna-directed dna polymerase from mobile element jockey-like n=1 Tax=Limosa lapponica baueri TaxID=1758121 RepID=A0A2I0UU40_LIMLA|nr:hypothetical protein llap_99 [Limosa lapponica baueri]